MVACPLALVSSTRTVLTANTDGVLNLQFAQTLAKGKGKIHGVDASEAMIAASKKAAEGDENARSVCTFEGQYPPR